MNNPPKKSEVKHQICEGNGSGCLGKMISSFKGVWLFVFVGEMSMGKKLGCPRKLVNGYIVSEL